MAAEKQIQANRRNAQRSTGPRTAAGKSISRRNALRHGLAVPAEMDEATLREINSLALKILGNTPHDQHFDAATEAAAACWEIARVHNALNEMLTTLDLATATPQQLWRLVTIDRYETRARTKRRRASARIG
jgi:hypothetical protein